MSKYKSLGKKALVEAFGNKCAVCNKEYDYRLYELHHVDPATKKFGLSNIGWGVIDKIAEEAKKCVLLCPNCHKAHHYIEEQTFTPGFNFNENIYRNLYELYRNEEREKHIPFTKEELEDMLAHFSIREISRQTGINRCTLSYWINQVYKIDWDKVGGRFVSRTSRSAAN